jgi:hypothetical protein
MAVMIRAARTIFSLEMRCQDGTFDEPEEPGKDSPGLANVYDIDSIGTTFPQVRFHMNLKVLRTKMTLCR